MARSVGDLLAGLDLAYLAPVFEEHQVSLRDLPLLSDDDLKGLGIALGPRRRLLRAIGEASDELSSARPLVSNDPPSVPAAERRHLCVMFSDLVGSTELSRRLDPEDLSDIMRRYQDAVSKAVAVYDGHAAKFLGDGVLVYFGWPQAFEDQVERAVRAGLDTVAAVAALHDGVGGTLAARVGIATGNVVVGDVVSRPGGDANAISGETPNLAARLQQLAEPGEVVIDTASAGLIGGLFELTNLGVRALKGFESDVKAWRVEHDISSESRFEAAHGVATAQMVGRDTELQLLMDRWELARSGEGQGVFVSGEAGIGKSRLLRGLQERVATDDHIPVRYQCSPHHANSALYPAVRQLKHAARFAITDPPTTKLEKLERVLSQADISRVEDAPIVADLLSIPASERYGSLNLPPQQKRERILEALLDQLLALAHREPVLFIVEDTHWIDPTSLELLERVLARILEARVLLAVSHRPEWRPPSSGLSHVTSLQLNRLGRAHGAVIARSVSGDDLDESLIDRIVARTDGVPLFIEELTKSLLEIGPEGVGAEIPATLQASLTERLDRLGSAKEVAQIGAVIGREFPLDLIAAVAGRRDDELNQAVEALVRSGLLFSRGEATERLLVFKHALVRDTAYESLLHAARRDWHRRIAEALEARVGTILEGAPEVVAGHWIDAGGPSRAIPLLLRAGHAASARSSTEEAATHFQRALELFDALLDEEKSVELELEILVSLGPALMNAKGFAHPDVGKVWARAHAVNDGLIGDDHTFLIVWNLWLHHHIMNDRDGTERWRDEIVRLADASDLEEHRLQAYHAVWTTEMPRGRFSKVWAQCDAGISIYDPERHHVLTYSYGGHDAGVCGHGQAALALSLMGFLDQGKRHVREAIRLAESLNHGPSQTIAWGWIGLVDAVTRAPAALTERTATEQIAQYERGLAVIDRFGPPHFRPNVQSVLGWSKLCTGHTQDALAEVQSGIEAYRSTGATLRLPIFLFVLAEMRLTIGDPAGASRSVEEALAIIQEGGDRTFWTELLRVRAEIALARSAADDAEVEARFREAVEVSRNQEARLSELRSATRLSTILCSCERQNDALDLLAPVFGWFTEGMDTPDVIAARELLESLR